MKLTWNTDRIVSLSAMVVGVGSLVIILYQTKLMREQQRASVMPYLMIAVQSNKDTTFLTLRNAGIGPAMLDDVRVRYKGKALALDPHDFFVQQRPGFLKAYGLSVDKLIPGRLIPAGEWIQTLGTQGAEPGVALLKELLPLFQIAEVPNTWLTMFGGADVPASDKAVVFVTYSSVYGEQWHLRSDSFVPVRGPAPPLP
jgi:hypothetical protein